MWPYWYINQACLFSCENLEVRFKFESGLQKKNEYLQILSFSVTLPRAGLYNCISLAETACRFPLNGKEKQNTKDLMVKRNNTKDAKVIRFLYFQFLEIPPAPSISIMLILLKLRFFPIYWAGCIFVEVYGQFSGIAQLSIRKIAMS